MKSDAAWNLYYRFRPEQQGRGYATELARKARAAAASVRPDLPVAASLLAHNAASRAVAEAAGLKLEWRGPDPAGRTAGQLRLLFADRELTGPQLSTRRWLAWMTHDHAQVVVEPADQWRAALDYGQLHPAPPVRLGQRHAPGGLHDRRALDVSAACPRSIRPGVGLGPGTSAAARGHHQDGGCGYSVQACSAHIPETQSVRRPFPAPGQNQKLRRRPPGTNTGLPVAQDQVSRMFGPFQRLDGDNATHPDGHGLGLSIVRAIAAAHDAGLKILLCPEGGPTVEIHFPAPHPQLNGHRGASIAPPQSPRPSRFVQWCGR